MRLILAFAAISVVASSAKSQPAAFPVARPPEQAAGLALQQCGAHSTGLGPIGPAFADRMRENGLVYTPVPPPQLQSMADTPYGHGVFAAVPSTEGAVWAVGYDSGICIMLSLGTATAPVETRLRALFAIPNSFKSEPIEQLAGAKWSQWRWARPNGDLVAQMNVREAPDTLVKGMVMVTLAPKKAGAK